MALMIVLLLLPVQVNNAKDGGKKSKSKIVGLAEHKLDEKNKVILAENSDVVKTVKDIKHYKKHFDYHCDVDLGDENILLRYNNDGKVKENGCTVDLLTSKTKKSGIKFKVGVNFVGECLTNLMDDNIIPFVYSLTNEEIEEHHSGPITSNKVCEGCGDKNKCITRTGLEVGWKEEIDGSISVISRPIGEPQNISLQLEHEEDDELVEIEMEIKEIKKRPKISVKPKASFNGKFSCLEDNEKSIISPNIWEIDGTSPDLEKKNLFVFHLLPLSASLKKNGHETGCGLYIKFSLKDFALLTVKTDDSKSSDGSLNLWILISVAVFIVILLSILAIVLVYFICKKKSSKENKIDSPYTPPRKPSDPKLKDPKPKPKRKVKTEDKYETITTKISQPDLFAKKGQKPGTKPIAKTAIKNDTKTGKTKTIGPTQRSMATTKVTQMGNGDEDPKSHNVQ
uniref:Uncharacterized protein n=1 Tax=Meloidogyne hapla TaxID=6305 RepID=A0A1I8BZ98_MELHA